MNIRSGLSECNGVTESGMAACEQVFAFLRGLGCQFFNFSPQYPLDYFGDETGYILPIAGLFHKILARGYRGLVSEAEAASVPQEGDATFSYMHKIRDFSFNQRPGNDNPDTIDDMARRQTEFLKVLAPLLRPQLCLTDQMGDLDVSTAEVTKRTLGKLFWYMIFGPGYCDRYGKDAFMKASADRTEDLGELGVAVQATESFSQWLRKPNQDLIDYYRKSIFKGIKPYRARHDIF